MRRFGAQPAARSAACPAGRCGVRVYAGLDPITGRRRYLRHTVPAGPTALEEAEAACRWLLTLVRERRHPRVEVTLAELLDRHLTLMHAGETTRRSYRWMVAKDVYPLLGHLRLAAVTPQLLDQFYAELERCRDTVTRGRRATTNSSPPDP